MKKTLFGFFVTLLLLVFLMTGCTGMNASIPVNVATDVAFVMALQNNPSYKAPVIAGLKTVKTYLSGSGTYDDLIAYISSQFGGKYAYVGIILSGYIATDTPIFETYLPMLGSYKDGVIAKIDRLLLLAESVGG